MKHLLSTFALLLALTPAVQAQDHGHHHADSSQSMPMDHGHMMGHDGMMSMDQMQAAMPQMMRLHEHMMADADMYQMMMADPDMRQMMQEMMGGDLDMAQFRQRMDDASPEERQQMMEQVHAQMTERMQAMTPEQRRATMERMVQMHQKMMDNPAMHEHMMADPEMHEMMQHMDQDHDEMHHDGMHHDGMN